MMLWKWVIPTKTMIIIFISIFQNSCFNKLYLAKVPLYATGSNKIG